MSHVTIAGTVASEPRYHTTEATGKKKTEVRVLDGNLHHTVIVWEKDITLAVGDAVLCTDGRIGYRSYDKDGTKVWVTEITCQNIQKLGSITVAPARPAAPPDDLGFE